MVEYYVEPAGNDANLGTAPGAGNAWLTVKYALETAGVPGLAAGDNVWIRRTVNEIPAGPADIAPAFDGAAGSPISYIGWPRAEEGAGSGVWANGSTEINDVAGVEMDREKHTGRRVKQDTDGHWYLITYIPYIAQAAGAIKLAFADTNPDTITDTDGRLVTRGFKAGDKIRITGSTTNNGTYTIADVVAGTITLVGGDALNTENSIDGTKIQVYDRFIIDREYAGTDTGDFTIQKDDDYDTRPVAAQATWDLDADDLPVIDFNDADFQLSFLTNMYNILKNFEVKDSTDALGIIRNRRSGYFAIIGCLLTQSVEPDLLLYVDEGTTFYGERVIIEGNSANIPAGMSAYRGAVHLKDVAIYNCGRGFSPSIGVYTFFENVNIGVEQANADDEIYITTSPPIFGRDVKLGCSVGDVGFSTTYQPRGLIHVCFENYGKILGAHKKWYCGGVLEKVAADGGGTRPNQRSGGAADVIEITPNVAGYEFIQDWAVELFRHEYEVDTTTRTWRYYVQNDACGLLAATNIWLELEYIEQYDDTSEYTITEVLSDETVANRADNNDWTQYIEVPNITPAVAGKVRITCYVSKHSVAGHIYIDPKSVNP